MATVGTLCANPRPVWETLVPPKPGLPACYSAPDHETAIPSPAGRHGRRRPDNVCGERDVALVLDYRKERVDDEVRDGG